MAEENSQTSSSTTPIPLTTRMEEKGSSSSNDQLYASSTSSDGKSCGCCCGGNDSSGLFALGAATLGLLIALGIIPNPLVPARRRRIRTRRKRKKSKERETIIGDAVITEIVTMDNDPAYFDYDYEEEEEEDGMMSYISEKQLYFLAELAYSWLETLEKKLEAWMKDVSESHLRPTEQTYQGWKKQRTNVKTAMERLD